jgi:hypothetical protein
MEAQTAAHARGSDSLDSFSKNKLPVASWAPIRRDFVWVRGDERGDDHATIKDSHHRGVAQW